MPSRLELRQRLKPSRRLRLRPAHCAAMQFFVLISSAPSLARFVYPLSAPCLIGQVVSLQSALPTTLFWPSLASLARSLLSALVSLLPSIPSLARSAYLLSSATSTRPGNPPAPPELSRSREVFPCLKLIAMPNVPIEIGQTDGRCSYTPVFKNNLLRGSHHDEQAMHAAGCCLHDCFEAAKPKPKMQSLDSFTSK